jgi:hypothetical protein
MKATKLYGLTKAKNGSTFTKKRKGTQKKESTFAILFMLLHSVFVVKE